MSASYLWLLLLVANLEKGKKGFDKPKEQKLLKVPLVNHKNLFEKNAQEVANWLLNM